MDFDFSAEQYMLRDSVRGMLADRWSMRQVRELVDGAGDGGGERGMPAALQRHCADLGLPAMLVPESEGGLGLGFLDFVLVAEEFGRALVPGQLTQTILASDLIARHGSAAQKARLLPRLADGTMHVAVAWLEADSGYDLAEIRLAAEATPRGYRLDGRKILVPYGDAAQVLLVAARLPSGLLGLFIVERNRPGLSVEPHRLFDPSSRAASITLDGVVLDAGALLGEGAAAPEARSDATAGETALVRHLDLSAAAAAAELVGCAASALDMAVAYAKQRRQFGQVIGSFQAIKHKCADMIVALETSRSAAYYAAWALSEDTADAQSAVSMAKAYAGDSCRLICNDALQIHGGIGYTWELDMHLYLKRGKALEYGFGDAAWHRERVIALAVANLAPAGTPAQATEA